MGWMIRNHTCPHCGGEGFIQGGPPPEERRKGHRLVMRHIRITLGMTQQQIARELLIFRGGVSQMEHGRTTPTAETLAVYAVLARRAGLDAIAAVLEAA